MAKELYLFTGLGADERIFHRLDLSGFSVTFIKWIIPFENETIEDYVTRLLEQITTPKPILVGLSFGGLIAIEVAKRIETEKVILIASVKTRREIPFYYRLAGKLRLHKIMAGKLLKKANFITNWFFGIVSEADKLLLKQILSVTDPTFLKWAIDKVLRWDNKIPPHNVFHIHGTNDRILPVRFVKCHLPIKNVGHLMTLEIPDQLSKRIRELLDQ